MKKLVFLFVLSLTILLFSCSEQETITIDKKDTLNVKYPKRFKLYFRNDLGFNNDGIVLGSDGHEYLIIDAHRNSQSVSHYIECEKCLQARNK